MVNVALTTGRFIRSDLAAQNTRICRTFASRRRDCWSSFIGGKRDDRAVGINRRSRYRVVGHDRGGGLWLKGRDQVDTLCHGEGAEWLNAAVSKTVTSVNPASGGRIPPSPRCGAIQHASAFACQNGDCAALVS